MNGVSTLHPPRAPMFSDEPRVVAAAPVKTRAGTPSPRLERARHFGKVGRAAVLWAFLLYALAQTVLNLTLDRWNPRMPDRVLVKKRNRLRDLVAKNPDRPLLVMFGSSRVEGAFQAGRMNGLPGPDGKPLLAYNFGVPATGPLQQLLFLRQMLESGIRPRFVLAEFLPPLLNKPQRGLTSEEEWISPAWLSLTNLTRLYPYFHRRGRAEREWTQARLAPWFVFRNELHARFRRKMAVDPPLQSRPHDPWGELLNTSPSADECAERKRLAVDMYRASLAKLKLGDGPSRAMRDLLELCRKEKVPVALVLTPEDTHFRTWYDPEGLAEVHRFLAELKETYGVPVIDATAWVPDEHFVDWHHVNRTGAEVFTTRLIEEVRPLLAR